MGKYLDMARAAQREYALRQSFAAEPPPVPVELDPVVLRRAAVLNGLAQLVQWTSDPRARAEAHRLLLLLAGPAEVRHGPQ